ncbi:hypothetical protein FQZ97_1069060 [compost metagenome]
MVYDVCHTPALVPNGKRFGHSQEEVGEQFVRRYRRAFVAKRRHRVERLVRRDGNVDAAADNQCAAAVCQALAFKQDAAGLLAVDENIVRPLDLDRCAGKRHHLADSPVNRHRHGQRQRVQQLDGRRLNQEE